MRKDDVEELRRMRLRWRTDPKTGPTLCVSLAVQTHLDILGHFTRAILCGNLQVECCGPVGTLIKHRPLLLL